MSTNVHALLIPQKKRDLPRPFVLSRFTHADDKVVVPAQHEAQEAPRSLLERILLQPFSCLKLLPPAYVSVNMV